MDSTSTHSDLFQNPDCLPLEDLLLTIKTEGIPETVPALSKRWIVDRYFVNYESPLFEDSQGKEIVGAKKHWMEIIGYIIDDLVWLLKLPYFRFWSNVVHNSAIMEMLISFLQEAPPYYALDDFPNNHEAREQLNKLRHYVLLIFARLVTNKESATEFMTRSHQGNLLYDNFIFTVPIILDLCQHYGRENKKTIDKILKSLFILQPLYMDDFRRAVSFLLQVFSNLESRFEDIRNDVILLTEGVKKQSREISLPILEDLIVHVLDVSSNLTIFLENYPPATELFQTSSIMSKIVTVYANTIPKMYEKLDSLALHEETMPKYMELKHRLDVSRVELLKLYRIIIYKNIGDILETGIETDVEVKKRIEIYLDHVTNAISEKEFITDYHRFYPVDVDLEILSQICPEVDTIKCDFILNSIEATVVEEKIERKIVNNSHREESVASGSGYSRNHHHQHQPEFETKIVDSKREEKNNKPNEVELIRLISEVKDILCHLGDGFIERCLKHYNYDSTSVINAVLEETLPSNLKELDFSLPYIPPDPEEAAAAVDSAIGAQRLNVFDNDEFDIMTNDKIDLSRVHRGKRKDKYKNVTEMLNDKSEIKKVEHIYSKYNLVSYEYDDEYDDTYDSHDIGESAQDDTLEMDRPFTTPRVLLRKEQREEEIYEEENDEGEESQEVRSNHFLQNPEELRARAEQRMLSRRGGRGSRQRDVVGNAKGQGQEKNVLINRDHKNTNKSSRANHNRRVGSQWKRRQGMIPS